MVYPRVESVKTRLDTIVAYYTNTEVMFLRDLFVKQHFCGFLHFSNLISVNWSLSAVINYLNCLWERTHIHTTDTLCLYWSCCVNDRLVACTETLWCQSNKCQAWSHLMHDCVTASVKAGELNTHLPWHTETPSTRCPQVNVPIISEGHRLILIAASLTGRWNLHSWTDPKNLLLEVNRRMSFDPSKHMVCVTSFHKQLYVGVKMKYPQIWIHVFVWGLLFCNNHWKQRHKLCHIERVYNAILTVIYWTETGDEFSGGFKTL